MKPEQAKEIAEKVFGPGSTVVREGSWCRVLDPTGKVVGTGESWKSALQMACQPIIAAEAARRKEQEAHFDREREEFADFMQALFFHWRATGELKAPTWAGGTPVPGTERPVPPVEDPAPPPLVSLT